MATLHLPKKRGTIPGKLEPHKTARRALDENLEEIFPVDELDSTSEPGSAEEALVRTPEKTGK